jgi:LVIVD repeat
MLRPLLPTVLLALAAAPALAGCFTPAGPAATPASTTAAPAMNATWYLKALAHDKDHDHKDVYQHMGASTPNFQLLGHDFLLTDAYKGAPAFGYGCGGTATRADGHRFVVVNGFQNDLTFVLVDVTNATAPKKVGEFYAKGLGSYDADITPDGKYVVLAFDGILRQPGGDGIIAQPELGFRSACTDERFALPDLAFTNGIVLVDVTNPEKPAYADWDPSPGFNLHSVSTSSIDNVTWVVGSELGLTHATSYFVFDTIVDTPLGPKLVRQSTFDSPPATLGDSPTVPITNGHTDVVMSKHPLDHKTYAYLADWEGGVVTLDMSVPQAPVPVAFWTPPGGSPTTDLTNPPPNGFFDSGPCYHNAVHEVLPAPVAWEGHHYIFAGQECPMKVDEKAPGGQVFVIDNTDPTAPKTVGEWHLPADTGVWTTEYQASPHYLALVNRTLFISDYHAGVWAADVSNATLLKAPPSIGVYLPALVPQVPPKKNDTLPFDEQVDAFPDGTLVLNEDTTGLYVLRFDATDPAPAAPPYKYG